MADRPTVLVSLGTIFFRTPGLYDAITAGLGREDLNLVVAIGHERELLRMGSAQPPNVHIEPYLPIPELLRDCALFVTHGGFNSVKEAVSAGTPMLVIPIASDQHYSADRTEALGSGRVVRPEERTPDRIREQARITLADRSYRDRAAALAGDMAALPSVDDGVKLLQQLAGRI